MNGKVFILTLLVLSCVIATVYSSPEPGSDAIRVNPSNSASNTNNQETDGSQKQSKRRGLKLPFLP